MTKNKTIQIQKSDSYLGDAPLGGFVVKSENRKLFENFCRRKHIPFLELHKKEGSIVYTMRLGLDMSDATYQRYRFCTIWLSYPHLGQLEETLQMGNHAFQILLHKKRFGFATTKKAAKNLQDILIALGRTKEAEKLEEIIAVKSCSLNELLNDV